MTPRKLSAVKSVSWRLIGVAMLSVITWVITRDLYQVTMISLLHHGAFIFIFYAHERLWERVEAKGKPFRKALAYELGLGFLVLGVITFVVTGSWLSMSRISVSYLTLRFIGYPMHDVIFERGYGRWKAHRSHAHW